MSGYWLWQVGSFEEALAWLKRAPFDGGAEVELRQVFSPEEFAQMSPELQEQRLRARE